MRRLMTFSKALTVIFIALLAYTRFVGIDWGLPYSMHPDERNMVIAIQHMRCVPGNLLSCFDPDFFAYGQLPLYGAYLISLLISAGSQAEGFIRSEVVTLALRIIAAASSVILTVYLAKIIDKLNPLRIVPKIGVYLILTFVPVFIQFSHFGTTESLLMMFVSIMIWHAFVLLDGSIAISRYVATTGIILGLAVGTKVSAVLFCIIPFATLVIWAFSYRSWSRLATAWFGLVKIAAISIIFFIIASPFNILDWNGFLHSMNYESSVGIGTYKAFYTRSFEYSLPVIFQFVRILPYSLGWPIFGASLLGLILLPWTRKYNLLRITLLVLFIPTAAMYAKWTRFIAPVFPLLLVFGTVFVSRVMSYELRVRSHILKQIVRISSFIILIVIFSLPGIAYLAIYQNPDVRFVASQWMYENIPPSSKILAETANVVDVPIPSGLTDQEVVYRSNLRPISFDFYELDQNTVLEKELGEHLKTVEYIFVPSRRIFW
ncbi:hypothetical protein KBD81_05185, partial [Candidatus Woesebacteria bacterium]|nr:hypothetical protein [Candidatus Woesebacteria bacterium]